MLDCRTLAEAAARRDRILADYAEGPAGVRAPRRRLRRRDDRDAPAGADAQVREDLELPRAAQQGDQAQVQRRGRLPQRRLGGQARGRPAHGGERPVGRDVQGLLLDRHGGARGEAGGARRDSPRAGEAHARGLAGGGGGCDFSHRFGFDQELDLGRKLTDFSRKVSVADLETRRGDLALPVPASLC